jgi:hypothetical protein
MKGPPGGVVGEKAGARHTADADACQHRPEPPHQGAQFAASERLPRIGAEVRHHQQSGRLAWRHHQGQQAGRNGRQPHADEALDETGEQERPQCDQENGRRHSEHCGIPLRRRRARASPMMSGSVRTTSKRAGQAHRTSNGSETAEWSKVGLPLADEAREQRLCPTTSVEQAYMK